MNFDFENPFKKLLTKLKFNHIFLPCIIYFWLKQKIAQRMNQSPNFIFFIIEKICKKYFRSLNITKNTEG